MERPIIAIGPKRKKPAWQWFGVDLAKELSKYYDIKIFTKLKVYKLKPDLILHVKSPSTLYRSLKVGKTIFVPVDAFSHYKDIFFLEKVINKCCHIIIHCHRLKKYFKKATYIEHHLKYCYYENTEYKENGRILWVYL